MTRKRRDLLVGAAVILSGVAVVYRGVFSGKVLAGRDIFRLFLPQGFFLKDCLQRGEIPLWNPNVWLGQPFAATLQSEAFYPIRVLLLAVADYVWVPTLQHLVHAIIAITGTWFLCRRLGASRASSLAAGVAFGLGPLFTQLSSTPNLVAGLAWSGWLLGAIHVHAAAPDRRTTSQITIVAALAFLAGSPEQLLWQSALALGAAVTWSRGKKRIPVFALAGLAWAVAATAFLFFPAIELALLSTRVGATDQLMWSVSPTQLLSAALPTLELPRGTYLGSDQWLVTSQFLGALVCVAACCARVRSRRALPFAIGAVLLLALSLGEHLWPAAKLLTLPPFSLFRYPVKYFLGGAFCICVLAALGLDRLAAWARSGRPKPVVAGMVLVVLVGVLAVVPLLPLRRDAHLAPVWFALVVAFAALAFVALPKGLHRGRSFRRVVLAFGLFELGIANFGLWHLGWVDPARLAVPSSLARLMTGDGRLSFEPQGAADSKVEDLAAAEIEASRDRLVPLRHLEERIAGFEGYEPPTPRLANAFRELDTRGVYDLAGVSHYTRPAAPPFSDLEALGRGPGGMPVLYRSSTAMPRTFVVHRAVLATDDQMRAALENPAQPARHTAFLEAGETFDGADCTGSSAQLTTNGHQEMTMTVNACAKGYLIVSDAYFPGWYASVNGAPAVIERVDLALRAVRVPAGNSIVLMQYHPKSFAVGVGVAGPALALIAFAQRRRKKVAP